MPDIQMRFHQDMLVLSSPLTATLYEQGVDEDYSAALLCVDEPETVLETMRMQAAMGVPCLVTPTEHITRARLAHSRLSDKSHDVAQAAVSVVRRLKPQHIIAQIGPTGLPLDPTSKTSLVANRNQYADAAAAFSRDSVDAVLVGPFTTCDDLLCALMGVRKTWDGPVFATVCVNGEGLVQDKPLEDALAIMAEYEADVAGFQTSASVDVAAALTERACQSTELPLLVQLEVQPGAFDVLENPYADADALVSGALRLRTCGAQFLQATGAAMARHAGALLAATMGLDAIR